LLQGLYVSPIQEFAVEILIVSEDRARAKDFFDRVRTAIAGADPANNLKTVFPEWFIEEVGQDETLEDTEGEWVFDEVDSDQAMSLLEQMAQGEMTMADLEG
jgi:hypothetical protein